MMKTLKNNTQQMMLMKMIRAAVKDKDFKNINQLFTYLMVNKEEEDLRRGVRNKLEAYSKIHKKSQNLSNLKEANDPLKILFDYVKKPYDTLDTLTNKYLLLVPEINNKLKSIRTRKEILHQKVKHLIKEDDALFMSDHSQDIIKHIDTSELENLGFDFENKDARKTIESIISQYDFLMSPITSFEKSYDFSEEQLTAARQARILSPHTPYDEILNFIRVKEGVSYEDRPEHLLAELEHIQDDKKASGEFFEKYQEDTLSGGVKKKDIDNLLFRMKNSYETSENSRIALETSTKNIFSDSLENYYSVEDGPEKTHFINHANGDKVEVDNNKLLQDPQYFTEIVAKLAKTELDNTRFKNSQRKSKEDKMIDAMMTSREFRKYYFFTRKFYHDKLEVFDKLGLMEKDGNGNFRYYFQDGNRYKDMDFTDKQLKRFQHHNHYNNQPVNLIPGSKITNKHDLLRRKKSEGTASQDQHPEGQVIDLKEATGEDQIDEEIEGDDGDVEDNSLDHLRSEHELTSEVSTPVISSATRILDIKQGEFPSFELFKEHTNFEEGTDLEKEYEEFINPTYESESDEIKKDEIYTPEDIKEFQEELIQEFELEEGDDTLTYKDLMHDSTEKNVSAMDDPNNIIYPFQDFSMAGNNLRNLNIFAAQEFDINNFRHYYPENEYDALVEEFDNFSKGDTKESRENYVRERLLGQKVKKDAKKEISDTVKNLFQDTFQDIDENVAPSKVLKHFVPDSIAHLNSTYKKELYFKRIYDEMFRDEMKREWLEFKQNKINQYLKKNSSRNQPELDLSVNFNALDDRTVRESINKIAAVDHVSNLIDLVEERSSDDVKVSRDHLAFELLDTFSDGLNQEGSLANEFYKDLYGDDQYPELVRQEQAAKANNSGINIDLAGLNEMPIVNNNKDIFEGDHSAFHPALGIQDDYRDAYDAGIESLKGREEMNRNRRLTPEGKAALEFEYIGAQSEEESDHMINPSELGHEEKAKPYRYEYQEKVNIGMKELQDDAQRMKDNSPQPEHLMAFNRVYDRDDEHMPLNNDDEDDYDDHHMLSMTPNEVMLPRRQAYDASLSELKYQLED